MENPWTKIKENEYSYLLINLENSVVTNDKKDLLYGLLFQAQNIFIFY